MRAGDRVRHRPTGEKWRVAYVRGAWCGWPPGEALVSDCDILEACSDEEHASALASWANSRGPVESGDRRREECAGQLVALANSVSATLGRTQADLDEALGLLRTIATHRDRDGDLVCAECEARVEHRWCDADCSLSGFLARFPADAAKGGAA